MPDPSTPRSDPAHGNGTGTREAWRWVSRPWRSPALLASLVAAFAAPAVMTASADLFTVAAGDRIAERLVEDAGASIDTTILASGELDAESVDALDAALNDRLERVTGLGPPTATLFTDTLGIGLRPTAPDADVEIIPGSGGRFYVREGALDALDVIAGRPGDEDGVWISQSVAEKFSLEVGDEIAVQSSPASTAIAGVYRDLWRDDRDPYWDTVPLSPRFSTVFGAALFELFVTSPDTVDDLGLTGTARFDAAVERRPDSLTGLERLASQLRSVERDFTRDEGISSAVEGFSGVGTAVPRLESDVFEVEAEALGRAADLDQPIATTALAGVVLGLVVSMAGAGFVARRRRREIRLLRSDGDADWRFFVRSLGEFVAPAALGTVVGVAVGWLLIRAFGPTRSAAIGDVQLSVAAACGAAGLIGAALTTTYIASRALEPRRVSTDRTLARWLLPTILLAIAAWVQVGAVDRGGDVDVLVVIFPIVGLVAGVGTVITLVRWAVTRKRRAGAGAPTALFLAWRRMVAAEVGALAVAIVVGASFGLVMFPSLLVESLDDSARAKATAVVGGPTTVQLDDELDEVPEASTIIRTQTTRLSVGARRLYVQVIDPETYASGVSWNRWFGSTAAEVVDDLGRAVDDVAVDAIPVVLVGDRQIPSEGAFGTDATFRYVVTRSLDATPLVGSSTPTILMRADRLDEVALERHLELRPSDVDETEWREQYRSPLAGYRRELVSGMPLSELTALLDAAGVGYRDAATLSDELETLDYQAVRWSFSYFRILAATAAAAATAGLLLYLSELRRQRELSDALLRRMGLRSGARLRAALIEVVGLMSIAFAAGTAAAIAIAGRIFARFEPDPQALPDTDLQISWPIVGLLVVIGEMIVIGVVLLVHLRSQHRSLGEILRGN